MKVRSVDVSASDIASSAVFFRALLDMYDLSVGEVLDMFARDGTITVQQYFDKVAAVDCWELMEQHRFRLKDFSPREAIIGCSYVALRQARRTYDMVVVDTPQGLHDDAAGNIHVEHFSVIKKIKPLLKPKAIIVLYVNRSPYDKAKSGSHGYDEYEAYDYSKWMQERSLFYQCDPHVVTEDVALRAYRGWLGIQGITVKSALMIPCYSDVPGVEPYAFRLGLEVAC